MTYDEKRKTFDCVATMREIRDRISSEIADKTYDDLVHWLHDHHYTDPVLQRLAIWSREGEPLDDPANNRAVVLGQRDAQTGEPYPSYKSSGVEWLGQVPAHWKVVQLRRVTLECCDGPFGTGLKSSHYVENGVRVVRLQNIGHGEFKNSDAAFISPDHYASLGNHSVFAGDLLIAGLGDHSHPSGRACVAPDNIEPAMVKADCFRFRIDQSRILPEFAAIQLTATAVEASAALATGATRQRTNLVSTSARPICIPGLDEQARILEYIGARVKRLRAAQRVARNTLQKLDEYRQRLISEVVTGKLDVRPATSLLPLDATDGEEKSL